MGKLIEEKALENRGFSLEEKVSEFLYDDFAFDADDDESDAAAACNFNGYGSESDNETNHPIIQHTLYWESQEALLQEILERYISIGSRLRQQIRGIIEEVRETKFCSCTTPSIDVGCPHCLRKRVISLLCDKGFNATLCVSKWKHTKKHPGGTHEYIEVITSTQGRKKQILFVIELEFRDQFEIAKACDQYKKLVEQLPECYMGKADYLKAIIGVMCDAAKRSMEEKKLHMGPWRKRSFMQMKWSNTSERLSVYEPSSNKLSLVSSRCY